MKILMMGTGPFAVPTFEALVASAHDVCGLVTRPDAGSHRRKRKDINPMRESAEKLGLQIHDPKSVNDADFETILTEYAADLFVVCDYGQILSNKVLSLARLGGINLHGSLLPKYRGAAPINWALYNGDPITGNTVIHMTPKLDGGPILKTDELVIDAADTAVTVETKLSNLGPQSVLECINILDQWDGQSAIGLIQDKSHATKAPRLSKSDGIVDWQRSASAISNQVRAFQPWPGTYSTLVRGSEANESRTRVILSSVRAHLEPSSSDLPPGSVIEVTPETMSVQTGEGRLEIISLQPSGKKSMPCADFMRGNPVTPGDRFEIE